MNEGMERFRSLDRKQRLEIWREVRHGRAMTDPRLAPTAIAVARAAQRTLTFGARRGLPRVARTYVVTFIVAVVLAVIVAAAVAGQHGEATSVAVLLVLAFATTQVTKRLSHNASLAEAANQALL